MYWSRLFENFYDFATALMTGFTVTFILINGFNINDLQCRKIVAKR